MFLRKNFKLKKVVEFTLNKITRNEIALYPDDINKSFNVDLSFGGYREKRSFYKDENQVIHAGMDVFLPYKEKLYMPFPGFISDIIYINAQNYQVGRGGGTQVIVWHSFDDIAFVLGKLAAKKILGNKKYLKIIYIHLDIDYFTKNLRHKFNKKMDNGVIIKYYHYAKKINAKEEFAQIGSRFNNGGWAPHVHIETFLKDDIETIDYSLVQDIHQKSAIGIIELKNKNKLDKHNLINPDIVFNLSKYVKNKQVMSLENVQNQNNLIQIKNLVISYDKKDHVIDNISLDIYKGEIIALLGPSGCGKTSLLNAISGFVKYQGKINIQGIEDISDIGYVFQDNIIYDSVSVFANIYLSVKNNFKYKVQTYLKIWNCHKLRKIDQDEVLNIESLYHLYINKVINKQTFLARFNDFRVCFNKHYFKIDFKNIIKKDVNKILEILDIANISSKKANQLSGGQKQRVAIAKAIIKKPILLIMDEPLSSLDAQIKHTTRNLIKDLQRQFNITLIFVTHDQVDAMLVADRVLLINQGKIQQFDSPSNIFNKPKNEFTAKFIGWPEINLIKTSRNENYYVRPQNIVINKSSKTNATIIDKQTLGKEFIYVCLWKDKNINIISNKQYDVNQNINISWNKKDIKIFKVQDDKKN